MGCAAAAPNPLPHRGGTTWSGNEGCGDDAPGVVTPCRPGDMAASVSLAALILFNSGLAHRARAKLTFSLDFLFFKWKRFEGLIE